MAPSFLTGKSQTFALKRNHFGVEVKRDKELCQSDVVSLALFDGDCAGMLTNFPNFYFAIFMLLLMI